MLWYMHRFKSSGHIATRMSFCMHLMTRLYLLVSTYKTTFSHFCVIMKLLYFEITENNWKPPDSKTGILDMYLNNEPMRFAYYTLKHGAQTSDVILFLMCNFLILCHFLSLLYYSLRKKQDKKTCAFSI